jgi:DNA-binding NtrC family response regulator
MSKGILIVDDEQEIIERIKARAIRLGFSNEEIWTAKSLEEAFACWKKNKNTIGVVVLDLNIQQEGEGWTLLNTFRKDRDGLDDFEVLIYSAHFESIQPQLEAIRTQTVTLYRKRYDTDRLWQRLALIAQRYAKAPLVYHFSDDEEVEMNEVANVCSPTNPILIVGGPGSGKTVKAREMAIRSGCARDRILLINCASLSKQLADGELFGSVEGSFTGSVRNAVGKMMAASGFTASDLSRPDEPNSESPKGFKGYESSKKQWGAVILDEIGSLDLTVQAKILLVLEGEPMQPIGWEKDGFLPNFRLIAATNELWKLSEPDLFRPDLFARLSTYILNCRDLSVESNEKISRVIEGITFSVRMKGIQAPPLKPVLTKAAIHELVSRKREIKGGYRELRSIVERAWTTSRARFSESGMFEITLDDIKRGWQIRQQTYSQFEAKRRSELPFKMSVPEASRVTALRLALAKHLDLTEGSLNRRTFEDAILRSKNPQKKNELGNLLGLTSKTPNSEKRFIYTMLGMALGFPEKMNLRIGTKDYADLVANAYASAFSKAKRIKRDSTA